MVDLAAIEKQAREYLADAMNEPSETYPAVFATYVREGVPSASASVRVETAITAIAFALLEAAPIQKDPAIDLL